MVLSFSDIKKREVINITDGRSFGNPTDIRIEFPKAVMTGITVRGARRKGLLGFFSRSEIFIENKNIVKIGGDVILVKLGENRCPPPQPKVLPCPPPKEGVAFFEDEDFIE